MAENEQLYLGGEICTMDPLHPTADALAVSDGMIIAVGNEEKCRSCLGINPTVTRLKDSVLLPGFIDTHLHIPLMVFYELNTDLSQLNSEAELKAVLFDRVEKLEADQWVVGLQFDESQFDVMIHADRHYLDTISREHPIILVRRDGHSLIANSAAMQRADVTVNTPTLPGGMIEREPNQIPSGVFRETAMSIILEKIPLPDLDKIVQAAKRVFSSVTEQGITSVGTILQTGEEGISGKLGSYDLPLMELLIEKIPFNLYSLLVVDKIEDLVALRKTSLHSGTLGKGPRIGGIKIWADGSLGSRTAFMEQPYSDSPDLRGFMIHSEDDMKKRMLEAHMAGEQIALHSIGDASTRLSLEWFAEIMGKQPNRKVRHRIEHASQLSPKLIDKIAGLNLIIATQPQFIHSEKDWLTQRLGPDRIKWTYPLRSLFDAGIVVAGASDAPVESLNVLHSIETCITREGFEPHQSITTLEALKMFTINAAYAQGEEEVKGNLTSGKRADMVILDGNPLTADKVSMKEIQVEQTICGGKTLYRNK